MSFSERFAAARKSAATWCHRCVETSGAILHGAVPMAVTLIVGFVLAATLFGVAGPEWLTFKFWRTGSANTSNSEVFRNLGLFAVAVFGLGFGIWRAIIAQAGVKTARKRAFLAEEGLITDRYTEAVKMLSADNAHTRVGAVYALARVAQDSVMRDHIPVMEVLTEFIRNPPYHKEADERAEARNRSDYPRWQFGAATFTRDSTSLGTEMMCRKRVKERGALRPTSMAQHSRNLISACRTSPGPTSPRRTSPGPNSRGPTSAEPTSPQPISTGPTLIGPTSIEPISAEPTLEM